MNILFFNDLGGLFSCSEPQAGCLRTPGLLSFSFSWASIIDVDKFDVNIYQILLAYTSLYTPILQIRFMCTNLFLLLLLFTLPWEVIFLQIAIINIYNWHIQIVNANCQRLHIFIDIHKIFFANIF